MRLGFDREKYIKMQSEHIAARRQEIAGDSGRLYLEMGGKLYDDMHASRVMPGFTPAAHREDYCIYDNKHRVSMDEARQVIESAGRTHSLHREG